MLNLHFSKWTLRYKSRTPQSTSENTKDLLATLRWVRLDVEIGCELLSEGGQRWGGHQWTDSDETSRNCQQWHKEQMIPI